MRFQTLKRSYCSEPLATTVLLLSIHCVSLARYHKYPEGRAEKKVPIACRMGESEILSRDRRVSSYAAGAIYPNHGEERVI